MAVKLPTREYFVEFRDFRSVLKETDFSSSSLLSKSSSEELSDLTLGSFGRDFAAGFGFDCGMTNLRSISRVADCGL